MLYLQFQENNFQQTSLFLEFAKIVEDTFVAEALYFQASHFLDMVSVDMLEIG